MSRDGFVPPGENKTLLKRIVPQRAKRGLHRLLQKMLVPASAHVMQIANFYPHQPE